MGTQNPLGCEDRNSTVRCFSVARGRRGSTRRFPSRSFHGVGSAGDDGDRCRSLFSRSRNWSVADVGAGRDGAVDSEEGGGAGVDAVRCGGGGGGGGLFLVGEEVNGGREGRIWWWGGRMWRWRGGGVEETCGLKSKR